MNMRILVGSLMSLAALCVSTYCYFTGDLDQANFFLILSCIGKLDTMDAKR